MTDNKNEKDPQTNYCCDCTHSRRFLWRMYCTYSVVKPKFDVITGKPTAAMVPCASLRDSLYIRCPGYEARGFAPPRKNMLPVPPLLPRNPAQQSDTTPSQGGVTSFQKLIVLCIKIRDDDSLPEYVHEWAANLLNKLYKNYEVLPVSEIEALLAIVDDYDYVHNVCEPRLARRARLSDKLENSIQ